MTDKFPGPVGLISAGSLHSLFVTTDHKLYGCGKNDSGQLGFKSANPNQGPPVEIKFTSQSDKFKVELASVQGGSLYSLALCKTTD